MKNRHRKRIIRHGCYNADLALHCSHIDEFANGVFIAELAPVNDPDFILQTLMNSFGFKDESGKTAEEILKDHLKDKELLLIIDNCEHLIKECAITVEMLLSNSTNLKIITTSRESFQNTDDAVNVAWIFRNY